jgi:hypothetical protein
MHNEAKSKCTSDEGQLYKANDAQWEIFKANSWSCIVKSLPINNEFVNMEEWL